jgi:LuxR family maltose regulon positive regulatory protein
MATPILTTKLSLPPKRPDWIVRLRLLNQLDKGLGRKLTLISAPAGSGKTTLAASWLHGLSGRKQDAARIAWLSLDQEDNSHLVAALQKIDPQLGRAAQAYLKTPHVLNLNHVMTVLINDLARHTERSTDHKPQQSILALDDYHLLNQRGGCKRPWPFSWKICRHVFIWSSLHAKSLRCRCLACACGAK